MTYDELLVAYNAQKELNASLQFQLDQLKKLIYGSRHERFIPDMSPAQLNLFSDIIPAVPAEAEKQKINYERKTPKKHPGRAPLPDHLPVNEIIIEPEEELVEKKKIGEDVIDTLEYTPASLIIRRTIRPKYVGVNQEGEEQVIQAPTPTRPINKSIAEASLLAFILVAKFVDHMPFYRQIQRFKRDYQLQLHKNTINDWFISVCTLLEPLYQSMVRELLLSTYIQADESHIKVQDGEKKGATHRGYQWVYHAPEKKIIVFHYRNGRGFHGPNEFLDGYQGWLQIDGYGVYDKIGKIAGIELVGCHVHVRRKFNDAINNDKARAEYALAIYQKIYAIERECKTMPPADRKIYRDRHTEPLLTEFKSWLDEQAIVVIPSSPIGKAISYSLNQWHKIIRVLDDGRLELDNNLIENKIRPLALGRKNYLFAGSHPAAQRIAMMYTFFATCKANEVNPYQWLKHVLEVIPDHKVNELENLFPGKVNLAMSDEV